MLMEDKPYEDSSILYGSSDYACCNCCSLIHERDNHEYHSHQIFNVMDIELSTENTSWSCADEFFVWEKGNVIDDTLSISYSHNNEKSYSLEQYRKIVIDDDTFELRVKAFGGYDGDFASEEWRKNGELHRDHRNPAQTIFSNNFNATEAYLDESIKKYYVNGKYLHSTDNTYKDILAYKDIRIRKRIGHDETIPEIS